MKKKIKSTIKAHDLCKRLGRVSREAAERAKQEGKDPTLAKHAEIIRTLCKRVTKDIIEIGRRLIEAKKLVGHDNWGDWLGREFAWSEQTARNFMNVFRFAEGLKSKKFLDLDIDDLDIAPSALYALARRNTPDEVREELLARAGAGEPITNKTTQDALAAHAAANKVEQPEQEEGETKQPKQEEGKTEQPKQAEGEPEQPEQPAQEEGEERISPDTWNGRQILIANKAAGDARIEDWTKFPLKLGVLQAVKDTANAWRRLVEHFEPPPSTKVA